MRAWTVNSGWLLTGLVHMVKELVRGFLIEGPLIFSCCLSSCSTLYPYMMAMWSSKEEDGVKYEKGYSAPPSRRGGHAATDFCFPIGGTRC